jgi:hypothetical protein
MDEILEQESLNNRQVEEDEAFDRYILDDSEDSSLASLVGEDLIDSPLEFSTAFIT